MKDELEQEHLAISVYPIDGVGNLAIQVKLATAQHSEMRPKSQHVVKLEIETKYNAPEKFSEQILALINGQAEKAVLENT